ncbi:MAG: acetyl-CoA hydrolase/transferase family protein [Chloroflexi bacterium]|nr:acetyl-CoA hydrolase/transferase family protein [Chloroflexota bacterium]
MDWREDYQKKLVTAEEAVKIVRSRDRVVIPIGGEPTLLPHALAQRAGELEDVELLLCLPMNDFGFWREEVHDSFKVALETFVGDLGRYALDEKRADYYPNLFSLNFKVYDEGRPLVRDIDAVMTVVSPPDDHGFCSFGLRVWNKRAYALRAKKVLVEVDANQVRTYGTNFIHVSRVDYFVENTVPPRPRREYPIDHRTRAIAGYVSSLIQDGDTIQVGHGSFTRPLSLLGVFNDKNDLGWHSEVTPYGIVKLVRRGVINGSRKTLHQEKVVATQLEGDDEDVAFMAHNPMFEVHDVNYVNDIRTIMAHDNMVAINQAMAIDLTGQIGAESVGPRTWNGSGGQPEFAIGAVMSKGGRSITVLPSTALGGYVSRIVAKLEPGTVITIPRSYADMVVTEHGIARLMGKSQRQRAEALIAIAHPDFRVQLGEEAQKLF